MTNCKGCLKMNLWSFTGKTKDGRRQYRCRNCGTLQLESPPQGLDIPAKVLYFDIETSLITVQEQVWDMKVQKKYIDWKDITQDRYVICWAGAWMVGDSFSRVFGGCVTQEEAINRDDSRIITKLRDKIDVADVVAGHNMRAFDWKTVNARIIMNGLAAPFEPKIADTLSLGRRKFKPTSQALEYWSRQLGGNSKDKMCRQDWEKIQANGDEKSLRKMYKYCKGDIREGANIFLKFKKYVEDSTGKPLYR